MLLGQFVAGLRAAAGALAVLVLAATGTARANAIDPAKLPRHALVVGNSEYRVGALKNPRNDAQARAFGFQGTPAFIVGRFRVPGVLDVALFKQAIKDAREAAKKSKK